MDPRISLCFCADGIIVAKCQHKVQQLPAILLELKNITAVAAHVLTFIFTMIKCRRGQE